MYMESLTNLLYIDVKRLGTLIGLVNQDVLRADRLDFFAHFDRPLYENLSIRQDLSMY